MSGITLSPGESVELPGGYVARSYREDRPYYAERVGDALSPEFATFDEARAWLELEHLRDVLNALIAQYGDTPAMCALVRYELDQAVKRARVLREERSGCALCRMPYAGSHYLGCPRVPS